MGFMDNFTSDSPVTVKQPDYYEMVKEAKSLLMRCAPDIYETEFEKIPEA